MGGNLIEGTQTEHGQSVDGRAAQEDQEPLYVGGAGVEACAAIAGGRCHVEKKSNKFVTNAMREIVENKITYRIQREHRK